MDLKLLKNFLLVAKLLNITKAAAQLSFSQPAITAQIYNLENAFGVKLFEREGRKLALTEAGNHLVPYAENIVSLYEEAQNVVRTFRSSGDTLRLAVSTQMINHLLPNILIKLQQQIPNLPISIEICMNIQEVIKGLLEHRYDLGFIHGNNSSPLILQHGVFTEDLIWVASKDFADKHPDIKEKDIETLPIINYTSSTVFRELFEQELKHKCIRSFIEYSDSAAIKRAVISGLGVSYLPRTLVEEEINSGKLIILDQGRALSFRISLVHQRDKVFSVPTYALLLNLANTPGVDDTIKELLKTA